VHFISLFISLIGSRILRSPFKSTSKIGAYLSVIVFSFATAYATDNLYKDINIISSDDNGISFRLTLSNPEDYVSRMDSSGNSIISVPILIAVPPGAKMSITNTQASQPMDWANQDQISIHSAVNSLANISGVRNVRGRNLATVMVYPYYQGTLYGQIDISLKFTYASKIVTTTETRLDGKVFNNIFKYSVLNFEQARMWPLIITGPITQKSQESVLNLADEWFKIETTSSGLIKVTGQDLVAAGMSLSNFASDSIHLFYAGGQPIPVNNSVERPSLKEMAIMVNDGGDGIFNPTDSIVFFAEGADRWIYPDDTLPYFLENHYTNTNCYWLAVSGNFGQGGKRIQSVDAAPLKQADSIIDRGWFHNRVWENKLLYKDNSSHIYDYFNWFWTDSTSKTFSMYLPNAIPAESAQVRINDRSSGLFMLINNVPPTQVSRDSWISVLNTHQLIPGLNRFELTLSPNYDAPPFFGFCEVSYQGFLTPISGTLDFYEPQVYGIAEYVVSNQFDGEIPLILDLSDIYESRILSNATSGADLVFQVEYTNPESARFYVSAPSRVSVPDAISRVSTPDNIPQADMYIIAPREFLPDLEDYRQYRSEQSSISVASVAFEDLVDTYSFGLYDPGAIRDFLKDKYENGESPIPSVALLVGDGVYDYENNLKTQMKNYIPPYIHEYDATSSDDNYIFFGEYGLLDSDTSYCDTCSDGGYDMIIARWPVTSTSQINTIVDKVKNYESPENFGVWRSSVTLVADDEYDGGHYEGLTHTRQTELLQEYHLPPPFRRNKIYSWEYPIDSDKNKPDVNRRIIQSINDGTLLVNYVGHGNPDTWAHEHIFNRGTDVQKLTNANRLTFVYIASCAIGFFDSPTRDGMAEELLRLTSGGAIAVLSATRLVYAGENSGLNREIYDVLFGSDDLSMCQAMFIGKLLRQYIFGYPQDRVNDRKYAFFGDPLVKLGIPEYGIEFTDYPDMLAALDTHQVIGRVIDKNSGLPVDFNGDLRATIYDSEIKRKYMGINDNGAVVDSLIYAKNGPVIFQGMTDVAGGQFEFKFIAPLDIGYGGQGARIYGYAEGDGVDAFGISDSISISSNITSTDDDSGPLIKYSFSDRQNFVSGDRITLGSDLNIGLTDQSGINLTGGTGHGITLTIDEDVENIIGLTDLFEYNAGSFTAGEIRYNPGSLPTGLHHFKVKAWDNANNSSVAEFDAEIVETGQLMLTDVMNYPNPMNDRTMFSFALTTDARLVSLDIFTLSGKKIMHYEQNSVPDDYYEFYEWDGRDSDGDRIATGVYIYKVTVFSIDSDEVAESFGKVVVIN